jgi:hypothetical protein
VDPHGLDVPRGVAQGFALGDAGTARLEIHGVGAEPLLGQLEGKPRARARLEEEVRRGEPTKRGHLGNGPVEHLAKRARRVENGGDFLGGEILQAEQVLPMADHPSISPIETPSWPSIS